MQKRLQAGVRSAAMHHAHVAQAESSNTATGDLPRPELTIEEFCREEDRNPIADSFTN